MIRASLWLEATMRDLSLLSRQQLHRIKPDFPVPHGALRGVPVR